jgi:hypothetical protein
VKGPHIDVDAVLDFEEIVKPFSQPDILSKLTEGEPKISYLLARKLRRTAIVEEIDAGTDQRG